MDIQVWHLVATSLLSIIFSKFFFYVIWERGEASRFEKRVEAQEGFYLSKRIELLSRFSGLEGDRDIHGNGTQSLNDYQREKIKDILSEYIHIPGPELDNVCQRLGDHEV